MDVDAGNKGVEESDHYRTLDREESDYERLWSILMTVRAINHLVMMMMIQMIVMEKVMMGMTSVLHTLRRVGTRLVLAHYFRQPLM